MLYSVEHHPAHAGGPALFVLTNADGAEDFKIVVAPLATPDHAHWRDLIPHRPGIYVVSFMVLADWLIRLERADGLPRIVVRRLADGEEHTIAFDQGVNVTLGLPLVRTSPDHGTAFDLAGTGEASTASMLAAIRLADRLTQ